jgi:hypothetical protein
MSMRVELAAASFALLMGLSTAALAATGTPEPEAGFTQVPVEQAGTSHGVPEATGKAPDGDGSTVVKQGSGTEGVSVPAKPCDPASAACPGADVKQ